MKGLMWKLLRKHVSAVQLGGFAVANLIGLTIVILAVQFYVDVAPIFNDDESFIKRDYLVITRKVTGMGALMGTKSEFDDEALADLQNQEWVTKVGIFQTSEYSVNATVGLGNSGRTMQTQFFFESIPDEYLDVNTSDWKFSQDRPEVPVIVSKDYLSLYNFGFAAAQGMPKVSEGMMGMIPLSFTLTGNGHSDVLPGRIVGFSSRLNTILVPEEFMEWSNRRYGKGGKSAPSRLIVEVNTPGDVRIADYMENKGYEIAGDKMNSGKANYFLTMIIGIVVAVGVIISLLSFFVLTLSIYLLLQKNTRKLQDLLMLGYHPSQVASSYVRLVVIINGAVMVVSIAMMFVARSLYMGMLRAFGVDGGTVLPAIAVAVAIMGCITTGNVLSIRGKIGNLWRQRD